MFRMLRTVLKDCQIFTLASRMIRPPHKTQNNLLPIFVPKRHITEALHSYANEYELLLLLSFHKAYTQGYINALTIKLHCQIFSNLKLQMIPSIP